MNVRLAAQTFSSSLADVIQFLMESSHPELKNAEVKIFFNRTIDWLFDLLNAKNPHGRGDKQRIRLENEMLWKDIIMKSINYLVAFKYINSFPLLCHRRKRFVLGFITTVVSTQDMALTLLHKSTNPFSYLLPYKYSQDHLE